MNTETVRTIKIACLILLLVLVPGLSGGMQGRIVHLEDGDSGIAFYQGKEFEFRLYGIDAPEFEQDFGSAAKSFSTALMLGKAVEMEIVDHDRYDREVVLVSIDGKCVNEELVKAGLAWVYARYCKGDRCDAWLRLERKAKQNRLGLWARKDPVPPWEYRERHRPDGASWSWSLLTRVMSDYRGNESSRVFHRKGCSHYNCKRCTVRFSSREEAIRQGYTPCGICKP